jgi:hypothetical protein
MWRGVVKGSVRELWGLGRFSSNPALSQCAAHWPCFWVNFLVPEAVRLMIRKHIGLRKVRENPKRISGMREKLNVLALLYDTQLIVTSLSIGLALLCVFRTAEKTRFSVRDFLLNDVLISRKPV